MPFEYFLAYYMQMFTFEVMIYILQYAHNPCDFLQFSFFIAASSVANISN